jgi:hypothetical protein
VCEGCVWLRACICCEGKLLDCPACPSIPALGSRPALPCSAACCRSPSSSG